MDQVGRIYLDTNIIIKAFETSDSVANKAAILLSGVMVSSPPRLVTSELTLGDLLVIPYKNADSSLIGFYRNLLRGNAWLNVQPVTRDILISAARLRAANPSRKLPDAVHVATAIACGCTHFLSSDKRIGTGPTEALPFTLAKPDDATLSSLIESMSR
jgi:predicted nucleic acid-binding protein